MISSNELKDISVAAMAITIVRLVFMLAVTIYMLESGQPAKMFPLVVPELWQAAYGQSSIVTPVIDPAMTFHGDLMSDLENATLLNATIYEDGTAVLLFDPKPTQYFPDGERLVIEVYTLHPYTSDKGYQFQTDENGTTKIYSAAGNEFILIQRNGTPGVEIVEGEGPKLSPRRG